jgi:hypothetical protein
MTRANDQIILREVETFLAKSGMGPSYFGKCAVGNSELVARLRRGGRIWPETADAIRSFINDRSSEHSLIKETCCVCQTHPVS